MNNENISDARDMDLMKRAKTNVWLRSIYKWLWIIYAIVNILLLAVWFFTYRGVFWPGMVMASWAFGLLMLGIIVGFISSPSTLASVDDKVVAEYGKLKNTNRQQQGQEN